MKLSKTSSTYKSMSILFTPVKGHEAEELNFSNKTVHFFPENFASIDYIYPKNYPGSLRRVTHFSLQATKF